MCGFNTRSFLLGVPKIYTCAERQSKRVGGEARKTDSIRVRSSWRNILRKRKKSTQAKNTPNTSFSHLDVQSIQSSYRTPIGIPVAVCFVSGLINLIWYLLIWLRIRSPAIPVVQSIACHHLQRARSRKTRISGHRGCASVFSQKHKSSTTDSLRVQHYISIKAPGPVVCFESDTFAT